MPSPISNQPLTDAINSSQLPKGNTTLHSFIPALPTLDTSEEQSANSLLHRKSLLTAELQSIPIHRSYILQIFLGESGISSLHTTVSTRLTILQR